jgi:hypothetical protein
LRTTWPSWNWRLRSNSGLTSSPFARRPLPTVTLTDGRQSSPDGVNLNKVKHHVTHWRNLQTNVNSFRRRDPRLSVRSGRAHIDQRGLSKHVYEIRPPEAFLRRIHLRWLRGRSKGRLWGYGHVILGVSINNVIPTAFNCLVRGSHGATVAIL